MPLKAEVPRPELPIRRILSLLLLAISITVLILIFRKPKPVAFSQTPQSLAANAESFQTKMADLGAPSPESGEFRLTAREVAAAIVQSSAAEPSLSADHSGDGEPQVGEPVVTFEGDQVKGQFASEIGGKKVYVTVAGHLGAKDGYATFDPTEFKVGALTIPVSIVNGALQKKLLEERDRLKLPEHIGDLRVEDGELVITRK